MMRRAFFCCLVVLTCTCGWCQKEVNENQNVEVKRRAKFEPTDGKCLVFIGQDTETIGGVKGYNGYCDYFDIPAGITLYSNLSPHQNSYGFLTKGNDGIKKMANWGAGDTCADCHLSETGFKNTMLSLGISMVNNEKAIAQGKYDQLIEELAAWVRQADRPIFLRIGYEFDGWDWNNYKRRHYLSAWERVHTIFQEMQVHNAAFVWQSKGSGTNQKVLEKWYPGDDIVDWCGYSYFGSPDEEMLAFARKHQKPVFIAEATPVIQIDNLYFSAKLSKTGEDERIWKTWFEPFFNTLRKNDDVIKAFSYINTDWPSQIMWKTNPVFKQVDARIQSSEYVSKRWLHELSDPRFLISSDQLFKEVMFK